MRKVAVLVAVMVAFAPAAASGHTATYATQIRQSSLATEGGDTVSRVGGTVESRREACLGGRKVVVSYGDEQFGTDTTDASGDWSVQGDGPTGRTYRFTVRRSRLDTEAGHRHICSAAANSKVLA